MPNFIGLRHVGWGVKDPAALAAFYRDVVGMTVVTELPADSHMGATVFMARHPDEHEHHDLVFFSNPAFAHTAFEVASLAELLTSHREVKDKGVPIKFTFNHGFWLSFYFDDPEGHNIEFFWRTGVWVPNDFQVMPINLERSEQEIMHDVELLREHFAGGTRTTAAEWNAAHGWAAGQQNPGGWNPGQQNAGQWGAGQQNANQWNANQWNANQQNAGQWGAGQQNAGQWGAGQQSAGQWNANQGDPGNWNKTVIEQFRANGGKVAMLPTPVLLLTTVGRKSGNPYTTPVGYFTDAGRLIVVPGNAKNDWYLNVLANPQVQVELGTESFTATATFVEGEERVRFLQQSRKVAEAAAAAWRPADAGDMADHVPDDSGPVVALQRVG